MDFLGSINFIKIASLLFSISLLTWGLKVYVENNDVAKEYQGQFDEIYSSQHPDENDLYEFFNLKLGYYKDIVKSLGEIQKGIIIIIIISLLMLFFGADKLTVFGYTVPDNLAFMIIFFGGQYLWANFGLTLNALIENRLSLHAYINELEQLKGGLEYRNSLRHVLSDSTLGDNWFSHYFDIYKGRMPNNDQMITSKAIGWLGLYGIYAVVLGIFKFSVIATTLEFIKRKGPSMPLWARIVMPFFLFMMLTVSTLTFGLKMKYCMIWLGSIWLVNTLALFFWHSIGLSHRFKK